MNAREALAQAVEAMRGLLDLFEDCDDIDCVDGECAYCELGVRARAAFAAEAILATPEQGATVTIDYTNWRDERALRTIHPTALRWGATEFHPEPQWLLDAMDVDKGAARTFALRDIHTWGMVIQITEPASEEES